MLSAYLSLILKDLPVCRRSRDATARCRYQHCISLLSQTNPLLHQPSFTLNVLLGLFWICTVKKSFNPAGTLSTFLQLHKA